MGETIAIKMLNIAYFSLLGGGALLQIPQVENIIEPDMVNKGVYNGILILTALLWGAKFVLGLYEKKKEIDDKYKKSSK